MKYATPCLKWADKLIASHTRALSPSDYLLLKEHLLTCPQCMAAHRWYLSVEAQLRTMPVLQPQRQLSTKLLLETETQRRNAWLPAIAERAHIAQKRTGIILATYSTRLKNLVVTLRRPGYALIVLLFCLLTTIAGIGTLNYASRSNTSHALQPPHLVASTNNVALNIVTDLSYQRSTPQALMTPLIARATLTLKNAGNKALIWDFNRARSVFFSPYKTSMVITQPSHGVIKGNAYSPVWVIVSDISYDKIAFNGTGNLARIVFTSNGGDVAVQTTLKKPAPVTPEISSVPQVSFSGEKNPVRLSMYTDYLPRKQNL